MTTAALVVALISVLAGLVTQVVQSGGTFFGKQLIPSPWLPDFAIFASFLGGASAQLASEPNPLSKLGIEQALIAGLVALSSGAAPGLARFAHTVVPMHVMEAKRAFRAARELREREAPKKAA